MVFRLPTNFKRDQSNPNYSEAHKIMADDEGGEQWRTLASVPGFSSDIIGT
jgi:hypothetical protein